MELESEPSLRSLVFQHVDRPARAPAFPEDGLSSVMMLDDISITHLISESENQHWDPSVAAVPLDSCLIIDYRIAYLQTLIGAVWTDEELSPGRIPLAFCGQCLDASCGQMWSAELVIEEYFIRWNSIGWEKETFKPTPLSSEPKKWWQRRSVPVQVWDGWETHLYLPVLSAIFDRAEYESAVLAEIAHQTALG